ncbi:hypothetical protein SAMN05421749_11163 [Acinetobacter marinus]|uniref:Uncharacterized protein n=1 Tax=Acinetobacter marinus TaxID=281375 RepID=A0A1G6NZ72_9GAMM|nr:hypothetical protein [Acinetobacter marinus]SDC73330.1 hypothetical protein SAMN05421749_11163 [Acinetobacter marinus]
MDDRTTALKNQNYYAVLNELSPRGNRHLLFGFGFVILLISILLPLENYSGFTNVGQSEILTIKHRILFDVLNGLIILVNIYAIMMYKLKGLSPALMRNIALYYHEIKHKKKFKRSYMYIFMMYLALYFSMFLFIIFFTPDGSTGGSGRRGVEGYYFGYIYFSLLFAFVVYYIFVSFAMVTVAMFALRKYVK